MAEEKERPRLRGNWLPEKYRAGISVYDAKRVNPVTKLKRVATVAR